MSKVKSTNNFEKAIMEVVSFDLRSLAVFRISLGIFLLGDLLYRAIDLEAHYTDVGVYPTAIAKQQLGNIFFCMHCMNGDLWFQALLFILAAFFAILLILGFNTRVVTFISWLFVISLLNRNPVILNIGDYILKLTMFWAMFLPLGARWSIDSYIANREDKETKFVASFGTLGYMIQISIYFLFAGLLKLKNEDWVDGHALFFVLNQVQYTTEFGYWMRSLPFDVLNKMCKFALNLELYGAALFFIPFRNHIFRLIGVIAFSFLLAGFAFCLDLENVHWISLISLVPLVPTYTWEKYISKINFSWLIKFKSTFQLHLENYKSVYKRLVLNLNGIKPSVIGNLLAIFFIVYVVQWNLISIDKFYAFPKEYTILGRLFRIDQRWGMFIPANKKKQWYGAWNTLVGYKKSRETINLMQPDKEASLLMPPVPSNTYKNYHWRRILSKNNHSRDRVLYTYTSSYLCKNWNENNPDNQIEEIESYFNYYIPELSREPFLPSRLIVWRRLCTSNEEASSDLIKSVENSPKIAYLLPEFKAAGETLLKQDYKKALEKYENIFIKVKDVVEPKSEAYINIIKMFYRLYFATGNGDNFSWAKTSLDELTGLYLKGYYDDGYNEESCLDDGEGCSEEYDCEAGDLEGSCF